MAFADHVLPHGPITPWFDNLWTVTGALPNMALPRTMCIWRGEDGLVLHSPVAVDEPTLDAILELGPVKYVVVPNGFHRLDGGVYKERFPEARLLAPAFARGKVEQMYPVDADVEHVLPPLGVACVHPAGTKPIELVYRMPVDGGHALVCADLLFNVEEHLPGIGGWFLRLVGSTGDFGMTRIGRMMILAQGKQLAAWLREEADRDGLRAFVPCHGTPIVDDCAERLRYAASRLDP
ncbi:MAG: hypothetical protein EP330_15440 [Deltaproteobacteria bacterium]|nr:MAG: hypothetical protein EP330_15440 [Deltaproteobacteria bacterium]